MAEEMAFRVMSNAVVNALLILRTIYRISSYCSDCLIADCNQCCDYGDQAPKIKIAIAVLMLVIF